ncbi:MAG: pyridoxal-phosphate dependent enzyme [Candidatus Brocadiae bacterium]|nr:pyridoxal-phosphate dependent enzyme [Candidatus Brocadiia bacterium]
MWHENILSVIGSTPMVRLNRVAAGVRCTILTKCEFMNPGGSVKDRIGIRMVYEAERTGKLKPGGTIIEGTSGNTGVGLAITAALRGYKAIFTITDKQSREKIDLLKAFGAEVIVCPTAVAPEDPRSYYSVAKRLSEEIPNSYYPNQYENLENQKTHYQTTGPEIWKDTDGKVDVFVAGMGTGGTISGVGRYLKEKKASVKVVGADPIGSLYHQYFRTGTVGTAHTYKTEGIGEDIFPANMDFSVLDEVVQVPDKEAFLTARRLTREEGIFAGGSSGSAVWAALEYARNLPREAVVVVLLPDTGTRNLGKVYNDAWMRENLFLDPPVRLTAREIASKKLGARAMVGASPNESMLDAVHRMKETEIGQLPVFEETAVVGSIVEEKVLDLLMMGKDLKKLLVREVMGPPFPVIMPETPLDQVAATITRDVPAVLVRQPGGGYSIITRYDLLYTVASAAML